MRYEFAPPTKFNTRYLVFQVPQIRPVIPVCRRGGGQDQDLTALDGYTGEERSNAPLLAEGVFELSGSLVCVTLCVTGSLIGKVRHLPVRPGSTPPAARGPECSPVQRDDAL